MKVLDLFSGIGGFSLGLERAGMETVAFCEYDDKARQVLKKHWPDVPQYHDVRTLTREQLENDGIESIRLICGGYPCQPFSTAGRRKGEDDDRHLWPELFRLVQEIRPTWVLCENVAGHITMGLDSVLADLEREGYACQPLVIPACAVGAYHRRDRVWILAYADNSHGKRGWVSSGVREEQPNFDSGGASRNACEVLANADCGRQQGPGQYVESFNPEEGREEKASHAVASSELGVWLPEPNVGRVAHGVPGRVDRLKQLGNAVVPQVVEMIGRAIMEAEKNVSP